MDQQLIKRIVEAALLAANQPLTLVQLQGLFPLDEPAPDGAIAQALETLQAESAERGVELVELASGWRFQVQADVHPWVARLWSERQTKYTRATLETLALIAYRQPITRGEIEQVRGVATNSNIIKALEEREWIRVVGHRDIPGRPELLGTTKGFLDYFGLKRLDELPPLSELKDFGELDPQFQFDGKTGEKSDEAAMPIGDIAVDGDAEGAEGASEAAEDANQEMIIDDEADHIPGAEIVEDVVDETEDDSTEDTTDEVDHDDVQPQSEETTELLEATESDEHALADEGDSSRSTT